MAANAATSCGVIGTPAESGLAGEGKVKTTGPFCPAGAWWTWALSGDGTSWVHCTRSEVAGPSRSAEQLAVAGEPVGGTICAPSAVKGTVSTVRGRIWPRISPSGRPAVWILT